MIFSPTNYTRLKYETKEEEEFWEVFNNVMFQVANFIPGNIWWYSRDYRIVGLNLTTVRAVGYDTNNINDVIGKTMHDFYSKKVANKFNQVIEQVMAERISSSEEHQIENLATGQIQYFMDIINPLINHKDHVMGIYGFSFEITDTKRAEQLHMSNQKQKAQLEMQEDFKKCLNELQQVITRYKIHMLNDKLGISSKTKASGNIKLTKREQQILYYLSLHKSPKEISNILSKLEKKEILSVTVQAVIDKQLYSKLEVHNIGQLLEKHQKIC